MSQEDVKKFYDYTLSIKSKASHETTVSNIIAEETAAFFSGQKSAEEVTDLIQNRVTTYLAENS